MEETIKEIKTKVEDIEAGLKSMLNRFNQVVGSSGCLGDLCNCITLYKGTETQMKDIIRQVKSFEIKLEEKDKIDIERDRKLEQLGQDITYMRGRQDVNQSQIGIPNANLRKERDDSLQSSNLKKRAPEKDQKPSKKSENETLTKDDNKLRKGKQQRFHEHLPRRKSKTDSCESDDNSSNSDIEGNNLRKDLTNLRDIAQTSQKPKLDHDSCKTEMNVCQFKTQEEKQPGTEGSYRPNFRASTEVELRHASAPPVAVSSVGSQKAIGGTCNTSPAVVEQNEKEYYLTPDVLEVEAKAEQISSQKTSLRFLEAVTTILLVDTSQSMASGDKWMQVKTFVNDYITGLEQLSPRVSHLEYLALVTFGAQTRCHQRYTLDFSLIRSAFDKIQLGGPSPLYGGLLMADSVSLTPEKDLIVLRNGMYVYTKIILITDGEPTEICLHRGPDIPDPKQMDQTKAALITMMDVMCCRAIDIFCVPVGNADMEFLHMLFAKEGGRRFLSYKDGSYFSRRLFLCMKFEQRRTLFGGFNFVVPRDDPEVTARDFAHMQEILDDSNAKNYEAMKRKEQNPYEESLNKRLLPIGSRVRRGPDWNDGEKDNDGPGTVIGHNLYVNKLWVNWDNNDEIRQYSYGEWNYYGVLPVEEPRIPLPGQPLDVGCVVSTGKDWKSDVASPGSRGVIIKMGATESGIRKALVHWENGKRAAHSYGDDKIYEIKLCMTDTSVPTMQRSPRLPAVPGTAQRPAIQNRQTIPAIKGPTTSSGNPAIQGQPNRKNKNKNSH
ncbi:uncharacterized protein LOC123563266 [Mercenaria mercenaria]|uniref:uncharacterized protein LOC123563266 n=1 Tax=Mercenaria mercenaria TaxID=6596 RepID=UPI00234EA1BD|nr:uncharacterized protein LOC123563266 [Mercenaria mercenaria]XP_053386554.1 uncharacterized protein LOC123563266 [Mercenaria mercenaria]